MDVKLEQSGEEQEQDRINSKTQENNKKRGTKSYEIDMCSGPLFGKMLVYSLPLMASGILQLLFNAADIIVVGRFTGSEALAAVGATSALINLLVNLFIGLSVGVNVMIAKYYGAGKEQEISETVHTAVLVGIIAGGILTLIGIAASRPMLALMDTPDTIIGQSVLYMRIYFLGMIGTLVYNFGGAVLRAVGDTKRPLYILFASGIVNVIFNLIFVILFGLGVAGVAIATAISQFLSAALIVLCLVRSDRAYRLFPGRLHINRDRLIEMAKIGIPAGMQGVVFSISNVLIQSSVNSFGEIAMAGNTAAGNLEGFVYIAMNTFHQTALSFTSQNYGAMKKKRILRVMFISLFFVAITGLVLGNGAYLASSWLLKIYTKKKNVIAYGAIRMSIICTTYFLCGLMDVMSGCLRGLGHSMTAMIVSMMGACVFRIIWIYTIFASFRTLQVLYWSYPASWVLTFLVHTICFMMAYHKIPPADKGAATVKVYR